MRALVPGQERRGLDALCGALLDLSDDEARRLAQQTTTLVAKFPLPVRAAFGAGVSAVDILSRSTGLGPLRSLDREERERVLVRLAGLPGGEDVRDALKLPVLLAWGADAAQRERSVETVRFRERPAPVRPDADLRVLQSNEWPSRSVADAVVVGSGAGGAMAARVLAAAGMDVIVLEEGRRFGVDEFRDRPSLDRFTELYRDAGTTMALGRPPVVLPIGRGVGGTTLVNSGTCYRTPLSVLLHWRDDHGLALADPDAFASYLDDVETLLKVGPVARQVMGNNGLLALRGAERLGWSASPLVRNAPGCIGSCECAVGCPQNAKYGVHLNALPEACGFGAQIVSEGRVEVILHEHRRSPLGARHTACGVRVRRPDGSTFEILAPVVVVAAGTTETPALLRRSGLGSHPEMGHHLAIHPAVSAAGWFEEPVDSTQGVLQSVGMDQFHTSDDILVEATATPPGMGSMVLPGAGRELRRQLEQSRHLATLGAMIGDRPSGWVTGRRHSVIRYALDRGDGARLVKAIGVMGKLLFASGATAVVTGIRGHDTVTSTEALEEAIANARPEKLHLAAFHPTGTARMGGDPEQHPVDARGRLRGVDGLWVADGSVVPSCPRVNPQVTIMALASAVAHGIE